MYDSSVKATSPPGVVHRVRPTRWGSDGIIGIRLPSDRTAIFAYVLVLDSRVGWESDGNYER